MPADDLKRYVVAVADFPQPGSGRVLLVDDVLATGGTLTAGAELCVSSGFQVCALVALIDLKLVPEFRWDGLVLRSALVYD